VQANYVLKLTRRKREFLERPISGLTEDSLWPQRDIAIGMALDNVSGEFIQRDLQIIRQSLADILVAAKGAEIEDTEGNIPALALETNVNKMLLSRR
jgi:hypothetical protein